MKSGDNYLDNYRRYAFVKLSPEAVEAAFRAHSVALAMQCERAEDCIAIDGQALKGSFDTMADQRAAQVRVIRGEDSDSGYFPTGSLIPAPSPC